MLRSRSFDGAPRSVGEARRFAADTLLNDLGMKPNCVLLVVSELATNAVMHAIGGYEVGLDASNTDVAVSVQDASSEPPHLRDAGPLAVGGRGLSIVATLSTSWGFEPVPGDGKRVWANVSVRPGAPAVADNHDEA